ncbi:alkylphosphonate utilization protein [Natronohydrobacter thiooxidans]|jgi:protein PhnA|uniref:alkylphosphonate utilization protein n=1 Tax=Natronohydrobacter thiooxidans TaxID=87172 RepID=UPI0008FF45EA|nr:alkylphosphonate utilization protein [Natronohydrobacter thiooxidans]
MTSCAICGAEGPLRAVAIAPRDTALALCGTCAAGSAGEIAPAPHWSCLQSAIWSERPEVQIAAWRLTHALRAEPWAAELLETVWLEPDLLAEAEAHPIAGAEAGEMHRDSNGAVLAQGDTVVLIKDLPVKGAGFTAKRGTAVRGISLVPENAGQIEGRVNGQRIVILTQFVKKSA